MKTRKMISFATAAVMALSALPVLSAGAADGYVLGDVDKDGIITGHDSALVSHSLFDDTFSLTDEETAQADVNQDGTVDQTDLDWIHENEAVRIADLNGERYPSIVDAYDTLVLSSALSAGKALTITDDADISSANLWEGKISQVNFNLMDSNGDRTVDVDDSFGTLVSSSFFLVGGSMYPAENRYDLDFDDLVTVIGDSIIAK